MERLRAGTAIAVMGVSLLSACVRQTPAALVQAVEALDRQLVAAQSAEIAPQEYARFVQRWAAVNERLRAVDADHSVAVGPPAQSRPWLWARGLALEWWKQAFSKGFSS